MSRFVGCLVVVSLLVVACGSDGGSPASTTTPSTVSTTTLASSPTVTSTTLTPTTVEPTTTATPTTVTATTAPCTSSGDTLHKESDDPLAMSSLIGKDIRVGRHDCFERIVIELQGSGDFPGWSVQYVDDPVTLGESNETAFIAGEGTLLVRLGSWMTTMEGVGYVGPSDIFPSGVVHVLEMRMVEDWEGVTIWAIGLDQPWPFTVAVLSSPARLVIDVLDDGR